MYIVFNFDQPFLPNTNVKYRKSNLIKYSQQYNCQKKLPKNKEWNDEILIIKGKNQKLINQHVISDLNIPQYSWIIFVSTAIFFWL